MKIISELGKKELFGLKIDGDLFGEYNGKMAVINGVDLVDNLNEIGMELDNIIMTMDEWCELFKINGQDNFLSMINQDNFILINDFNDVKYLLAELDEDEY